MKVNIEVICYKTYHISINIKKQSTTKYTQFYLLFARNAIVPRELYTENDTIINFYVENDAIINFYVENDAIINFYTTEENIKNVEND